MFCVLCALFVLELRWLLRSFVDEVLRPLFALTLVQVNTEIKKKVEFFLRHNTRAITGLFFLLIEFAVKRRMTRRHGHKRM